MTATGQRMTSVSSHLLVGLYAVVPVCVAVAVIDWALGGTLRRSMPAHPDQLALFTIVFNLPHVVASELLVVDRQYFRVYRGHVTGALILGFVGFGLLAPVSPRAFHTAVLAITLVHVFGQQTGIVRILGGAPRGKSFRVWRWGLVATALTVYLPFIANAGVPRSERPVHVLVGAVGVVVTTGVAAALHRGASARVGKIYLWSNQVMLVSMVAMAATGYSLLAILMPRVVHDVTAYVFYVVHDVNRNRDARRNLIYRAFGPVPVWFLGPVLSLAIAYGISRGLPLEQSVAIVGVLSIVHYYMEALTWRRGGLYRALTPVT